jgi:PmbA protein
MMINTIIAALAARHEIADWRITERSRHGEEAFFVGRRLDMRREVAKRGYDLVVYVDGKGEDGAKTRGEATVAVHPTMDEAEVSRLVERAAFAAARSRNPWYSLPGKAEARIAPAADAFAGRPISATMGELATALYAGEARVKGANINSLELFLAREETRIVNSRGVDARFEGWKGYVEFTVEAASKEGPVELTDFFSFAAATPERFTEELATRLRNVADRALATPTPTIEGLPLILTGANAEELLGWFHMNLNAYDVYGKSSPFELGASVHGPDAGANGADGGFDPVTLYAEARLEGAAASAPFDPEGIPLDRVLLCDRGVAKKLWGPSRYAAFLGLPPEGNYPLFSIEGGTKSVADFRAQPHIEAAFFSDFTVDESSGDFGGEIRLAYVFDGKERRPVTGGSITGSLFDNRGSIRLSKEVALVENMLGPEAVLLPKVSITGLS